MDTLGHQQLLWVLWNNSLQIQLSTRQDCICYILLDHYCSQNFKIGYLWSWTVYIQIIFQNIQITLEETWYYLSLCMELLTLESYFLISLQSGYLRQASLNINVRYIYIITMHQIEQNISFYLMLITVSIGTILKILENVLWMLQERDSMWASWDKHIGSCQSEFLRLRTILFQ